MREKSSDIDNPAVEMNRRDQAECAAADIEYDNSVPAWERHLDRAFIVASSSIYVHKCALVASYLEEKGIAKGQQLQEVAGGFALRVVGQNNWAFYKNDSPLKLFTGKPIVLVSSSVRYCTNWGRLSARATDSRGD